MKLSLSLRYKAWRARRLARKLNDLFRDTGILPAVEYCNRGGAKLGSLARALEFEMHGLNNATSLIIGGPGTFANGIYVNVARSRKDGRWYGLRANGFGHELRSYAMGDVISIDDPIWFAPRYDARAESCKFKQADDICLIRDRRGDTSLDCSCLFCPAAEAGRRLPNGDIELVTEFDGRQAACVFALMGTH